MAEKNCETHNAMYFLECTSWNYLIYCVAMVYGSVCHSFWFIVLFIYCIHSSNSVVRKSYSYIHFTIIPEL